MGLSVAAPSKLKLPQSVSGGSFPYAAASTPAAQPVDYAKLIQNDYGVTQTGLNTAASTVSDQAGLLASQQAALVRWGDVPGSIPGTGDVNAVADPTTRALASANTAAGNSTVAQLRHAYEQQQQTSDASLAARGILRSGAYGQHANENLQGYNQAGYQASQQLMDYLSGLYSGYQSHQETLRQQNLQSQNDALNRIIAQINAGTLGGGTSQDTTANTGPAEPQNTSSDELFRPDNPTQRYIDPLPLYSGSTQAPQPFASPQLLDQIAAIARKPPKPVSGYAQSSHSNLH